MSRGQNCTCANRLSVARRSWLMRGFHREKLVKRYYHVRAKSLNNIKNVADLAADPPLAAIDSN